MLRPVPDGCGFDGSVMVTIPEARSGGAVERMTDPGPVWGWEVGPGLGVEKTQFLEALQWIARGADVSSRQ